MGSSLGKVFRVTTFGESHGPAVGAVIDGCPPRLPLEEKDIQPQLDRRRPGQSPLSTARSESDRVTILSGTENGVTLGSPITLVVTNRDQRPSDYHGFANIPRPSHADFTYRAKYGIHSSSGGGRSSARETVGRVAAGAVAEKLLKEYYGVQIVAWVSSLGSLDAPDMTNSQVTRDLVDKSPVRCPHPQTSSAMIAAIQEVKQQGDSIGGIITCVCRAVPPGWGEPVFDKLEACLAHAMLSIPATKGFEIGSGFSGSRQRGSQHNDAFIMKTRGLGTATNRSGGVQGGISNGEQIVLRVAFKPPASIARAQKTADYEGRPSELKALGRHDPCVVPRAVPIVESMCALVLADLALRQEILRQKP